MKVNMLEAKNQLSRLVKEALEGKDVVIASNGEPKVRLVPVNPKAGLRGWGSLRRFARGVDRAFAPDVEEEVSRMLKGRR
jgi:prevent-host-death family protein